MTRPRPGGVALVGLSGPDGVGKSSQLAGLVRRLRADGAVVVSRYGYGCPLCRRVAPAAPGEGSRPWLRATARRGERLHALVDALDLARVLAVAWFVAAARGRWRARRAVVVTDRGPLDGLVRHAGTGTERLYRTLLRRYRIVLLLDAPAGQLAAHDGEHPTPDLERMRRAFAAQARHLPVVTDVDAAGAPDELAASITETVTRALVRAPGLVSTRPRGAA